ncbi:MAG: DMT family transporter [Burkholderiales bacterium]|nr:MAG: DMT family transporter [Burkholderiales bacterium]
MSSDSSSRNSPQTFWGIFCALGASFCFATLDTTSQLIGMAAPIVMVQWLRYLIQTLSSVVVIAQAREFKGLRITKPALHITRGLMMLVTTALGFTSLRYVPVADVTAIVMLTPLVVTIASARLLGEHVPPLRWLLALGSFCGVLIVIRPFSHAFEPVVLLVFLLVAVGAAFQLLTAYMMRTESASHTHLASGVTGFIVMSCAVPFFWQALPLRIWALIAVVGLAASTGHLLLNMAFKRVNASVATPYLYAQLGFAAIGGWLLFGRVPDAWGWLGMALVAVCGIANAWVLMRENRASSMSPAS